MCSCAIAYSKRLMFSSSHAYKEDYSEKQAGLPRRLRFPYFFSVFTFGRILFSGTFFLRSQVALLFGSYCSRKAITSFVIGVGVEAPDVTATVLASLSQSKSISITSATLYAFVPAISSDTCAKRLELLLLGSPTTIVISASLACCDTASWRICVAWQISLYTSTWGYFSLTFSIVSRTSHWLIVVWFVTISLSYGRFSASTSAGFSTR